MASPISPVTVGACFTFRLVSLEHDRQTDLLVLGTTPVCPPTPPPPPPEQDVDVERPHEDDSPVQFGRLHVDQIERLTAGQQQEIRLKAERRTGRAIRRQINLRELCPAAITDTPP